MSGAGNRFDVHHGRTILDSEHYLVAVLSAEATFGFAVAKRPRSCRVEDADGLHKQRVRVWKVFFSIAMMTK
eukprot:9173936-Pyramimonas_sp.AAC.1